MDNMTALVSCFARAYHCRNSNLPVFVDPVAEQMLTAEEYDTISRNMAQGIRYFAPGFKGTAEAIGMHSASQHSAKDTFLRRGARKARSLKGSARRICMWRSSVKNALALHISFQKERFTVFHTCTSSP